MPGFGSWFAELRAARQFFTQDALADAARVSRSTVQSIERGEGFAHRHASVRTKLASLLGFSSWELEQIEAGFKRKDYQPPHINGEVRRLSAEDRLRRLEDMARANEKLSLLDALRQTTTADQLDARNLKSAASQSASAKRKQKRKRGDRP
jgi:transcriptional regulator with XRE-family HTH domain